jgi:ABC-2 type transport system ATP-binding protein
MTTDAMTTDETEPETPEAPEPVVTADGLGLRTRRGWVFRDVDLTVAPGELVAITGPAGSGRTSLLLALAGHFRTTHGSRALTGRAGIGLVPGVNEPEAGLTAAEHVQERLLLLGRSPREAGRWLDALPVAQGTLGRDLTPYERHRLMLRLAEIGEPALLAVDDVDTGLSTAERAELWRALEDLAGQGPAVLVTCREPARSGATYDLEEKR